MTYKIEISESTVTLQSNPRSFSAIRLNIKFESFVYKK